MHVMNLNTFLQTEVDEGAKGGCHGKREYDIVLFRTQPDTRQDNDHQFQHVPGDQCDYIWVASL